MGPLQLVPLLIPNGKVEREPIFFISMEDISDYADNEEGIVQLESIEGIGTLEANRVSICQP